MTLKSRLTFVVLWVLSLLVVGVLVSVSAQAPRDVIPSSPSSAPVVFSGSDLGFRADGWKGKARTGTFVVKINGEWVDAIESATVRPVPIVR